MRTWVKRQLDAYLVRLDEDLTHYLQRFCYAACAVFPRRTKAVKMIRLFCIALLCTLVVPATFTYAQAATQSAATQSPADTYNNLLTALEKEVVDAADAMPADKYNFAPTQGEFKGVRTFGEQVKHLAEANYFFFQSWNVPGAVKEDDIEKLTSKDDIVKALRDSYAYAHSAISTLTPATAFEEVSFGQRKTTRAGIASILLAHTMDHYGQMVVYLRMNGIVPPASRKST
jgi:uncharacterized damage-inducible protein DinB